MPAVVTAPAPGIEGAAVPFAPSVLDPAHVEGRIEKSLLGKVRKLVDEFPERAVEVVRAWMAEGY